MKRGNKVCLLLGVCMVLLLGGILVYSTRETEPQEVKKKVTAKAKDTFYFTGDNIREYKGESTFYVDMLDDLSTKQVDEAFTKEKQLGKCVNKLIFPDKYDGTFQSPYGLCFSSVELIYCGKNMDIAWMDGEEMCEYKRLREIIISSENKEFYSIDGVAYGQGVIITVPYKWNKKKLVIPKAVTYVNTRAICCPKIDEIKLHNKVKEVARDAISTCEGGENPERGYGSNEFLYMENLKRITLEKGSKYYKMKDGALYKKEGKGKYEFEGYPMNNLKRKRLRIMEGTTEIDGVYCNRKNFQIILPRSLKKYKCFEYAFTDMRVKKGNKHFVNYRHGLYNHKKTKLFHFYRQGKKIPSLYFPSKVTKILTSVLGDIKKIKVYVKGGKTGKQWQRLKKGMPLKMDTKVLWVRSY